MRETSAGCRREPRTACTPSIGGGIIPRLRDPSAPSSRKYAARTSVPGMPPPVLALRSSVLPPRPESGTAGFATAACRHAGCPEQTGSEAVGGFRGRGELAHGSILTVSWRQRRLRSAGNYLGSGEGDLT